MPLQFLIGTGQNDNQSKMIQQAKAWVSENSRRRVFFIVPNYNKFEQELLLLSAMNDQQDQVFSTIQTQVFSFNRLAWYFLQKDGQIPGNTLSDAGNAMIFRKVLQEKQTELTVFRGEATKNGFIEQLASFYQELQIGNLAVTDFDSLKTQTKNSDQQLKLADLQIIYQGYEEALLQYQVQNEDPLSLLNDYLASRSLEDDLFIVSGYTHFNARELQVLTTLMTYSQLLVSLTVDKPYLEAPNSLELFAESGKVYYQLKSFATINQIPVKVDQKALETKTVFNQIGQFWQGQKNQKIAAKEQVKLWKFPSVADEVRQIGNEIRRLVREKGYRYQDIQILIRDFNLYDGILPPLFEQLEIPYYFDQSQAMVKHPLVEFLESLFAIDSYYYRISDVFRLLRTELFAPFDWEASTWEVQQARFREQIDQTENVCLAYNFRGSYWTKKEPWEFVDENLKKEALTLAVQQEENANLVKRALQQVVPTFFETIKAAKTGREAAMTFYRFLEDAGVKRQLLFWRDQEVERGELEKARNHEQTWQALIDLLDEYVLIYGEATFSWPDFQEIFLAGLLNLDYGRIPTTIDQVKVNNLELARIGQAKVTFALGLNQKTFPARFDDHGLLSPEERDAINSELPEGKFLPENNSHKINQEPYLAYSVFLSALDTVYLSYSASLDGEKRLEISPFLRRLSEGLQLPVKSFASLNLMTNARDYLGTTRTLLSDLNCLNRLALDERQPLPAVWQKLAAYLEKSELSNTAKRVFASLTALNVPESLRPETAEAIYGKDLYVSVSRIENFYNCQYKYFANFGLALKERTIYGLTSADSGEFYHEALDRFFTLIRQKGLDLVNLTEEQRSQLADQLLQEMFGAKRYQILASSARMNYLRYQLAQTIQKVSWGILQQGLKTDLKPQATEVVFGSIGGEKGIPGIDLTLNNGGTLAIRGKIDRLDTLSSELVDYLSVVDYKSGKRDFDLVQAYYGLALQLITYLDVALTDFNQGEKEVKPIGAYYLHVNNPVIAPAKDVEKEILKSYQYEGLFADDPEIFEHLDHTLEEKESSLVFPVKRDAKGNLVKSRAKKNFFSEAEINTLREYNRNQILAAGNELVTGEIKLNPAYENKERIACKFCPFRSVCKFDPMLKENNYHRLEKLEKDEILKRMEETLDDNEK